MLSKHLSRTLIFSAFFLLAACGQQDDSKTRQLHAPGGVISASISQNAQYALVASVNQPTILWNIQSRKALYNWSNSKNHGRIIATAFSPDAKYALTAEKKNIALWNIVTGKTEAYWLLKTRVLSVALGNGGHYALLGYKDNRAEYIDLHDGRSIRRFAHSDKVNSVAISNNERFALTGSDDKTAGLWNIQTGKKIHSWQHKKRVTYVLFSPNNRLALTNASQGQVLLWNVTTGKRLKKLNSAPSTITAAAFSKDGNYLAVGHMPQQLTLWNVETGQAIKSWRLPKEDTFKPKSTIIRAVSFSANGQRLLTEDSGGHLKAWAIPKQ